jgi:spore germination protein YaaH
MSEEFKTYTIVRGDNLTKIAKAFDTTVDELVKLNNIKDPNLIYAGAELKIPYTKAELEAKAAAEAEKARIMAEVRASEERVKAQKAAEEAKARAEAAAKAAEAAAKAAAEKAAAEAAAKAAEVKAEAAEAKQGIGSKLSSLFKKKDS